MEKISKTLLCDLTKNQLLNNLFKRLESLFYLTKEEKNVLEVYNDKVLDRVNLCFSKVDNKYFRKDGEVFFSYTHSGQYLCYLYIFSNG